MKNPSQLFGLILIVLAFSCKTEAPKEIVIDPLSQHYDSALWPFYQGVASGDPLPDRVIIWTHVAPNGMDSTVNVTWEMAEDPNFVSIYKSGDVVTSGKRDFTVKVD